MAEKAEEVAQADDLLDQLKDLQRRTLAILEAAETTHQHRPLSLLSGKPGETSSSWRCS
jgi:hypothetical protein